MHLLSMTEKTWVVLFVVATMLSIGMQTRVEQLRSLLAARGIFIRTVVANFLLVPVAGIAVAALFPLPPAVVGAIVLLACTPGGLSALQFAGHIKGSETLAAAILGSLALSAVFLSPVLLKLVLPGDVEVVVPYASSLLAVLLLVLLPILAGMLLLESAPSFASRLSKPLGLVGIVAFIAFVVATGDGRKMATGEIGLLSVTAMLLFIAVCMAIGWLMGGPQPHSRQVLATSTSMRNAAFCLAIVESSSPDHPIVLPLVAFSLLMVPTNLLFTIYCKVHDARASRQAAGKPA